MNKEEKQPNVYMIPKNSFDTGYVFGGAFKTKNFIEGVVVAIPFLGIFIYGWTQLGWDVESTVAYGCKPTTSPIRLSTKSSTLSAARTSRCVISLPPPLQNAQSR